MLDITINTNLQLNVINLCNEQGIFQKNLKLLKLFQFISPMINN